MAEKRRETSLDDTRKIHVTLVELTQVGIDAHTKQKPIEEGDIEAAVQVVRQGFLLIPDYGVRESLADALTVISNLRAHNVADSEWTQACLRASFVVAAYLRGEQPPAEHTMYLRGLRRQYESV